MSTKSFFSSYFIKFIRAIALWDKPELWSNLIMFLHSILSDKSIELYYTEFPNSFINNSKTKLSCSSDIYKLVLQISVYLLKCDIKQTLEILTKINVKHSHINLGDFEDLTKTLQNVHFSENINIKKIEKPKSLSEKTLFVFKNAVEYYPITIKEDGSLFKLTLLNSSFKDQLKPKIAKHYLMSENIEKPQRKILWEIIATSSSLSKKK